MSQQGLGSTVSGLGWWIEVAACTGNTTSLVEGIHSALHCANLSRLTVAPNMDLVLEIIIAAILCGSQITTGVLY